MASQSDGVIWANPSEKVNVENNNPDHKIFFNAIHSLLHTNNTDKTNCEKNAKYGNRLAEKTLEANMKSKKRITLLNVLEGLVAGAIATLPMTWAMNKMFQLLPARNQSALPPRKITMKVADQIPNLPRLEENEKTAATLVAHYAYGAAMGGIYSSIARKMKIQNTKGGILFGLAVWTGSYLGLLPAIKIHRSALKEPWRRNALMIAAHIVWGATMARTLRAEKKYMPAPA